MQRVLREAMDAGAAGFATSFAIRRTGASTASRCRAGSPSAPSSRRCSTTMGDVGRGVVAVAPGDQCHLDDIYDLQLRAGVPVHVTARCSRSPDRRATAGCVDAQPRRAGNGAREVWPQVTPATADVRDDPGLAVHAQRQPDVRRADGRLGRRAHARPTRIPTWRARR